ncbi:MAG TPA: hypothetical protein VIK50_14820 [Gemmatimonadaceae bacterium]
MRNTMFAVLALSGLVGCTRGELDAASSGSGRNLDLLATDTVLAFDDQPLGAVPGSRTLAIGSRIDATWGRTITSRKNKAGETVTIIVTSDVKDGGGRVVIPSGATVALLITELAPATSRSDSDGKLTLSVTSTTIRGRTYSLQGDVTSVPHSLKGRGIGKAEAVKVGVGTAIGAAAGQVIGRDTKSTVIGGAVGAVGGAAVAAQTASRDVVVSVGSRVLITLTGPFTVAGQ